jgi:hypothetical protein
MKKFTTLSAIILSLLVALASSAIAQDKNSKPIKEKGFKTIWDGKTFDGWKIAEPEKNSWSIQDGAIVARGQRSHLFYIGDSKPFVNFELKVEVMTEPKSNGGIYFHTAWQETGWPKNGFEVQVNQSHGDWKKTGSLYDVVNVKENYAKDNEWYTYHIIVKDKHVTVKVNDQKVVDWEQPADREPGKDFVRMLDKGTFAFQAHDPGSVIRYRHIRVKRL